MPSGCQIGILIRYGNLLLFASVPDVSIRFLAVATIGAGLWRLTHIPKVFVVLKRAPKKQKEQSIAKTDWLFTLVFPAIIYIILVVTGVA